MRKLPPPLLLGFLSALRIAEAQTPPPAIPLNRASAEIQIDGDLSDPGWQGATVLDTFYETSPADNVPAKVKTTAYVVYDQKYLYIGVRCDDPDPGKIRAPFVDRDLVLGTDDNVAIFLDTRNDRRVAYELRINPRGIQADGIFNDGATDDNFREDFSPDFFYDTAAQITGQGWNGEFRIPFSSLRYPDTDPQTWGILVWRNYPREYRYAFHNRPIPRGSNCLVCHTQPLGGLTGLPPGGHLVVAPYATATETGQPRAGADPRAAFVNEPIEGDGGLDVKWTPNANTAVDAALNPDFSQIEADVAQIAVNERFALFFPEKRPFFLEGVDLLTTPIQAVYTRTITSPRWGLRGTGKIGSSAYTVLLAEDRGGGLVILPGVESSDFAPQDYRSIAGVARLRQDFGRSFAGLLVTDREVRGGGHNRVIGPDFQWRPTERDQVTAQFLYSDTETPDRPELFSGWDGRKLSGGALNVEWLHTTPGIQWSLEYRDFGDGFRADNGFVPQVGYREGELFGGYNFYPKGFFRQIRPYVVWEHIYDREGDPVSRFLIPGVFILGTRNLTAFMELNFGEIRVAGDLLERTNFFYFVQIDPSRRFSRISLEGNLGEEIDFANGRVGDGIRLEAIATLKPTDHLALELIGSRQTLDVTGQGSRESRLFTAHVGRLKATYTFSARTFLRLIGQYVETRRDPALYRFPVEAKDGTFDGSALFSYKLNWQTVLFLGYGDSRVLLPEEAPAGSPRPGYELVPAARQFFLKVSYAFQG